MSLIFAKSIYLNKLLQLEVMEVLWMSSRSLKAICAHPAVEVYKSYWCQSHILSHGWVTCTNIQNLEDCEGMIAFGKMTMHNKAMHAFRFQPNSHKEKESVEKMRARQQQEQQLIKHIIEDCIIHALALCDHFTHEWF